MRVAERNLDKTHLASLGELSRGLFHDLASPLTAITLVAETLCAAAARDPETARVCATELLYSCHDLRGLVQTIREYIANPKAARTFSLREAAEHAARLVRHRARRAEAEIVIASEEAAEIFGRPLPIIQVLVNLLGNAADSCGERAAKEGENWRGRITVSASASGGVARLSVSDNGIGLDAETAARVFERHFTTKDRALGTGIGLDTVRRSVEKILRGKISVSSAPNAGAIFSVEFPVDSAVRRSWPRQKKREPFSSR
jgi:signal transduction histidine kinase